MSTKKDTRRGSGGNVRIGIVSFITLVSVLLLAVLSVLCVTTARATASTASRQADSATGLYEVDAAGQGMLAAIDSQLAQSRSAHESAGVAASRVQLVMPSTQSRALELSGVDDVQINADVKDANISFTIKTTDGRELDAEVSVNDDLTYTVSSWKTSTTQAQTQQNLWGGSGAATGSASN